MSTGKRNQRRRRWRGGAAWSAGRLTGDIACHCLRLCPRECFGGRRGRHPEQPERDAVDLRSAEADAGASAEPQSVVSQSAPPLPPYARFPSSLDGAGCPLITAIADDAPTLSLSPPIQYREHSASFRLHAELLLFELFSCILLSRSSFSRTDEN